MRQPTLFELPTTRTKRGSNDRRKRPLDRDLVIEALRDIHRLSGEPHIRQIAEDVLFAHRIPVNEE